MPSATILTSEHAHSCFRRFDFRHSRTYAPKALAALQGSDLIIHAGDVGAPEIIEQLRGLAPVIAVRGNVDKGVLGVRAPATAVAEAGSALIYILHDIAQLDLDPATARFNVVVSGHSHKPGHMERNGVMYLNPGSAGPRRFQLPVTVARLDLRSLPWKVEFIDLLNEKRGD